MSRPVAALLYQKANNHWLRKLAHGRELYLVPTGDIAAVVFATELLSQLRNRGIDLDHVSQTRARQDGKTLDKTSNTKYAAQLIAEHIQGWLRIPNMRSPISAFSWLSFVNAWEMTMQRYQHHLDLVSQLRGQPTPLPSPHQSNVHYWETPPLQLHQLSIQLASSRFQTPRMPGWLTTCPPVSLIDLSPSG